MGKRELGLILAFVVAGVIVWQVTAPKAEGPGFSLTGWLREAHREVGGRRASAEITTAPVIPVDASINELRLTLSGEFSITGEDRDDVAAELRVVSNGFDEAEAKKLAGDSRLNVSRFADSVVLGWFFPDDGSQRPRLTLRVPSRLRIQIEGRGNGEISGVAGISMARTSGTIKLSAITGVVKGEYRGGDLTIDGADAVDLTANGGEAVMRGIRDDVRITTRGAEVRLEKARGRVTITGNDARIRVEGSSGELRAEMIEGDLELNDVAGPIEIDTRSTPVTVSWARAAAAKIQVRESSLELIPPANPDTYALDARASGGELRAPDHLQKSTEGRDTIVTKNGGANAPSIFVRGIGASITIR